MYILNLQKILAINSLLNKFERSNIMKNIRIISLVLLAICVIITVDLGYNFFASLIPELNDGIAIRGILSPLIFGDRNWSKVNFFYSFSISLCITVGVFLENLILSIYNIIRESTQK